MEVELYLQSDDRFGPCLTGYFRGDLITFAVGKGELSEALIWAKGKLPQEEFARRTTFTVCRIFSSVEITATRKIAYRFTSNGKVLAQFPGLVQNRAVDYIAIT